VSTQRFFSISLYEALAIGFLSFISLHVYELSVNQAVHKLAFSNITEQVMKNTSMIDWLKEQSRFPPKKFTIPNHMMAPDRRKMHSEALMGGFNGLRKTI